jgi:hypothetical protein
MAKKKSAPKHVEPEEESQELPEEEPETEEEATGKAISKAAAVRDALEQGEESPEDGVAYIKKIHGIEMTRQTFSSYKAQEKSRQAKKQEAAPKAKPGRKPREVAAPSQAVEGYLAPPSKPPVVAGETDLLAAMEAMKPLVASLGADKVKRIVDLLG